MEELPRIPRILDSAYLEAPFVACAACGASLAVGGRVWNVQKAFRAGEVVFELAICLACMEETTRGFSEESLARMQAHFAAHFRPTTDLTICHLCRQPPTDGTDYEIGAVCVGDRLMRPPIVVCAACSSSVQEQLSEKTRGAWGEFLDRTLPGVPGELQPDRLPLTF